MLSEEIAVHHVTRLGTDIHSFCSICTDTIKELSFQHMLCARLFRHFRGPGYAEPQHRFLRLTRYNVTLNARDSTLEKIRMEKYHLPCFGHCAV